MLYPKEEINKLKGDLKSSVQSWAEDKIDGLSVSKPGIKPVSVYLKRGLNNLMDREDERINRVVDKLALFVTDKSGGINSDTLIDDAVSMFRMMDKQKSVLGGFEIEYGKGEVSVSIPRGFFMDMLFGDLGCVKITADDLLEIKELIG